MKTHMKNTLALQTGRISRLQKAVVYFTRVARRSRLGVGNTTQVDTGLWVI